MSILEKINQSLLNEQNEKKATRERSGKLAPSQFGKCYRAQILRQRKTEETNPPDVVSLRKFKVGNIFHDFVQSYVPVDAVEVLIENEDVKGYADIVSNDSVVDIKSIHSQYFWRVEKKKDYNIQKEKYTNWLQVCYYALQLGKKYAKLLLVSKDDLYTVEYTQVAEDWKDDIECELHYLKCWRDSNKLPPAEPRAYNGKECNWCPYRDLCKSIEEEKEQ